MNGEPDILRGLVRPEDAPEEAEESVAIAEGQGATGVFRVARGEPDGREIGGDRRGAKPKPIRSRLPPLCMPWR